MFKSSTEGINSLAVDDVARQAVPLTAPVERRKSDMIYPSKTNAKPTKTSVFRFPIPTWARAQSPSS